MEKGQYSKLKAIARINSMVVSFKEQDGTILATTGGVSFTVTTYTNFDAKLKEIKRMPPKKQSLLRRLFRKRAAS